MLVEEIKKKLNEKLKSQRISSRVLLDKLRLIDEDSRKSSQYQDPNYLPFYYYLSRLIKCSSLLHIGFELGLPSCCFLQGGEAVQRILCFQREGNQYYSPKLGLANIRDIKGKKFDLDYYYGKIVDELFIDKMKKGFDVILITEKLNNDQINETLDICWEYLNLDGFLIVDHVVSNKAMGDIFSSFSKGKNKDCEFFKTRYGTGLLQK